MVTAISDSIRRARPATSLTDFLDELVPLTNATHADVVSYAVDIPMRYAECFAELRDGRRVPLKNRRQLVGWTGYGKCRSLLFRSDRLQVVIDIDDECPAGPVSDMHVQAEPAALRTVTPESGWRIIRKFIGIDGSLVERPVA